VSNACCALILFPCWILSCFSFSLPELLKENDTYGSELVHWHTYKQTLKHLSLRVCMRVAAQSCGRVGLWQLSLRRGCADQGWAENQGLAVLEGEVHDSSPTWEPYLLAAASPSASSPWALREGNTSFWLTQLSVWLNRYLCMCWIYFLSVYLHILSTDLLFDTLPYQYTIMCVSDWLTNFMHFHCTVLTAPKKLWHNKKWFVLPQQLIILWDFDKQLSPECLASIPVVVKNIPFIFLFTCYGAWSDQWLGLKLHSLCHCNICTHANSSLYQYL